VPFLVRWPGVVKPGGESRVLLSAEDLAPTLLAAAGVAVPARMTGANFLPLLKGEAHTPRKHVFVERGPHGSAPVSVTMSNSGYDLARAVRSDRYKFIYNCTPWIPYSPVDSAGGAAWKQMTAANTAGKLSDGLRASYFTAPRQVYELYDLESDPSELNNLSGRPEVAAVERELRIALAEKMILDFDYLPLPAIPDDTMRAEKKTGNRSGNRAATFAKLDTDGDGKLNKAEFSAGRKPAEAEDWFTRRDADRDGLISRNEYLSESPALPGK
jgi:N-sulfoglucosamine sulfohydrolase